MSTALHAYRPRPVIVPALVRRDQVPPAEWTGMLLDRARLPLWEGVAVDARHEVTPALRMAALADLVPPRGVVGRCAAAWVHIGGSRPATVDVLVTPGTRRTDPHPLRRAAEGPLPARDVLDLGTGRVTTVQRTGLDIARYAPADEAVRLLVGLLPHGYDPHATLDVLAGMAGGRGTRRARALLEALLPLLPPGAGGPRAVRPG